MVFQYYWRTIKYLLNLPGIYVFLNLFKSSEFKKYFVVATHLKVWFFLNILFLE